MSNPQARRCGRRHVTFAVGATGSPPLIPMVFQCHQSPGLTHQRDLVISSATSTDAGFYHAVVTMLAVGNQFRGDAHGSCCTPHYRPQPTSRTVDAGTDTGPHVSATGGEPLHFQWGSTAQTLAGATLRNILSRMRNPSMGQLYRYGHQRSGSVEAPLPQSP